MAVKRVTIIIASVMMVVTTIAVTIAILASTGVLTFASNELVISTFSVEKIYDGTEISCLDYKIDKGEISKNHHIRVLSNTTFSNAGEKENILEFGIYDQNDNDITANYDLKINYGKLTILPYPIVVKTESAEFIYDGQDHIFDSLQVFDEQYEHAKEILLPTGDRFFPTVKTYNSVGVFENKIEFTVLNKNGEDISLNFNLQAESGNIKIKKKPITIITLDKEKTFDNTPLEFHSWEIDEQENLVEGHQAQVTINGIQEEIGSSDNTVESTIIGIFSDKGELLEDLTENYTISYEYGTLTIVAGDGSLDGEGESSGEGLLFKIKTDKAGVLYLKNESYSDFNGDSDIIYAKDDWESSFDIPYCESGNNNPQAKFLKYLQDGTLIGQSNVNIIGSPLWLVPYYTSDLSVYGKFDYKFDRNQNWFIGKDYSLPYYSYDYISSKNDIVVTEEDLYYQTAKNYYCRVDYSSQQALENSDKFELDSWKNKANQEINLALINAIANKVKACAKYDIKQLTIGDNISQFLENGKGVCHHFATTATLLYRLVGIPARLVDGFYININDSSVNKEVAITETNAHAWVEVYLEGIGWIPVEVTPSSGSSGNNSKDNKSQYKLSFNTIDNMIEFDYTNPSNVLIKLAIELKLVGQEIEDIIDTVNCVATYDWMQECYIANAELTHEDGKKVFVELSIEPCTLEKPDVPTLDTMSINGATVLDENEKSIANDYSIEIDLGTWMIGI